MPFTITPSKANKPLKFSPYQVTTEFFHTTESYPGVKTF